VRIGEETYVEGGKKDAVVGELFNGEYKGGGHSVGETVAAELTLQCEKWLNHESDTTRVRSMSQLGLHLKIFAGVSAGCEGRVGGA
jgi:hypothetical protein